MPWDLQTSRKYEVKTIFEKVNITTAISVFQIKSLFLHGMANAWPVTSEKK